MSIKFCKLCSKLVALASEYKCHCRNADQMVCIESCAKLAHAMLNAAVSRNEQCFEALKPSLRATCEWCNEVCSRLHVGNQRECCREFHDCCSALQKQLELEAEYRGGDGGALSENTVRRLAGACGNMLYQGMILKSQHLVSGTRTTEALANAECCLHLCSAVRFACHNVSERLDAGILTALVGCAERCNSDDFCSESALIVQRRCQECLGAH